MATTIENIQAVKELLRRDGEDPEKFFPSCVGCGYCCKQATCSLGVKLHGAKYPCPELRWIGEQYRCALVEQGQEAIIDALYIGSGCCSLLNSWRKEKRDGTMQ